MDGRAVQSIRLTRMWRGCVRMEPWSGGKKVWREWNTGATAQDSGKARGGEMNEVRSSADANPAPTVHAGLHRVHVLPRLGASS